jgi:hypothetical protein
MTTARHDRLLHCVTHRAAAYWQRRIVWHLVQTESQERQRHREYTVSCSVFSYPWPPHSAWPSRCRPAPIRTIRVNVPLAADCSGRAPEPRSADWPVVGAGQRLAHWSAARWARSAVRQPRRGLPRRHTTHHRHHHRLAITTKRPAIRRRPAHIENGAGRSLVQASPNAATGTPRTGAPVRNSPPMVGLWASISAGRPSRSDVT